MMQLAAENQMREQIRLRGILSMAFGNILCLRGFASAGFLASCSRVDESYQRRISDGHSKELEAYLARGRYQFYPEIVLGLSLEELGCKTPDVDFELLRRAAVDSKGFPSRAFGDKGVSMSAFAVPRRPNDAMESGYTTLSIFGLPDGNDNRVVYRIDGNHRLSTIEKMSADGTVGTEGGQIPFCLIFFTQNVKCQENSAVFFHNINFHQLPVPESHLLDLVFENSALFSDEVLWLDPSFGAAYGLARSFLSRYKNERLKFVSVFSALENYWSCFVLYVFRLLLTRECMMRDGALDEWDGSMLVRAGWSRRRVFPYKEGELKEHEEEIVDALSVSLDKVFRRLTASDCLEAFRGLNWEMLVAMAYFSLQDESRLNGFVVWLLSGKLDRLQGLPVEGSDGLKQYVKADVLIEMYESFAKQKKHTIFVSMQFNDNASENHFKVIRRIVREINLEYGPEVPLSVHRIDIMDEGYSYEINRRISEEIARCGLLIANLTCVNPNVYHEIGMAMGRAMANGQPLGADLLMILDESVQEKDRQVKFNLQSFRQIRFTQSEDLASKLKAELLVHFGIKRSA